MDGEAFHNARAATEKARKEDLPGGVFLGYGVEDDLVFNGFARILSHHWSRLTNRQRETLSLRRAGRAQVQIAATSGVTESAVSQATRKAGWQAYSEAERGFRAAFRVTGGSFEALAFLVAAKGLIRAKEFDHRPFAEYFLVGSLCSVLVALIAGTMIRLIVQSVAPNGLAQVLRWHRAVRSRPRRDRFLLAPQLREREWPTIRSMGSSSSRTIPPSVVW